jgi:hypothetical protein
MSVIFKEKFLIFLIQKLLYSLSENAHFSFKISPKNTLKITNFSALNSSTHFPKKHSKNSHFPPHKIHNSHKIFSAKISPKTNHKSPNFNSSKNPKNNSPRPKTGSKRTPPNWSTSHCLFVSTQKGPFLLRPLHHFEGRQTEKPAKRPHK